MNIVSQRQHTALVNGGVFVYVPKNVVVEHPVQYVVLHDDEKCKLFITMLSSLLKKAPKSHMLKITYQMHLVKGNQLNIISEVIAGANPISHMAQWTIWIKALQVISFDVVLLKRMPQLIGH